MILHNNLMLLAKLIVIGMLIQLLGIGYVLYQSYEGRADLTDYQRAGCERGKLDRFDNAEGQRRAGNFDLSEDLLSRARIDCKKEYPKADLLP